MILFILGIILVIIVITLVSNKTSIDIVSFFKPSLPLDRGKFGIYCFTGKQGTGKTYSTVKFIVDNYGSGTNAKIYSNITIDGLKYKRIKSTEDLLKLRYVKNAVIIYDEIFTLLSDKSIPKQIRGELMEFMTQQRKMGNIMITTAQEWLELPMTYRRFVRIQIDCSTRPLGRFGGILIERYYDATQMKWSDIDNEYIAPIISTKISKYQKRIMIKYDTFERVFLQPVSN